MIQSQAVAIARVRAKKLGRPVYIVKDGLAPDDQWEVCSSDFELETHYQGATCVREVDADGLQPEGSYY